jgi:ketosteroid isomerase-like protein
MNTEILPHGAETPAMTADHMRRAIFDAFHAYETDDRAQLERVIAEEFSFTSPYDDAIDRAAYFERCWPNHKTIAKVKVERIFIEGDGAFVTYLGTSKNGRSFRNTEYFTFRGGKIASVDVYFGAEYEGGRMKPAEMRHPNRTN